MATKKNSTTKNTADAVEKKVNKAAEKVENKADSVSEDVKKAAHKAEETAKEMFKEGKKSVEDLMDKVIDEEKLDGYWSTIKNKFATAQVKDRIIFVLGAVFLIWALVRLTPVLWGIILLLVSIVLMNMFFSRK